MYFLLRLHVGAVAGHVGRRQNGSRSKALLFAILRSKSAWGHLIALCPQLATAHKRTIYRCNTHLMTSNANCFKISSVSILSLSSEILVFVLSRTGIFLNGCNENGSILIEIIEIFGQLGLSAGTFKTKIT
jgi:hypothetical protein